MITALVLGGAAWLAVATGVALGIGKAIHLADQHEHTDERPHLRLVA